MPRKAKPARKSPSSSVAAPTVPQRSLKRAGRVLTQLPDKPPACSMREAIALLQDAIYAALSKGYSREDVTELLNEAGIPISATSLRYYLTRLSQAASQPQRTSSAQPSAQPRALKANRSKAKKERSPALSGAALSPSASSPTSPTDAAAVNRSVEDVIAYLLDELPRSPQSQQESQDADADSLLAPDVAANSSAESALPTTPSKRKKQKR